MNGNRAEQTTAAAEAYGNCQEILKAKTRLGWQINAPEI